MGVATAIGIGGPGALFWMWVTGLLGMASKYDPRLRASTAEVEAFMEGDQSYDDWKTQSIPVIDRH